MKNVKESQLRKAICITFDEYVDLILALTYGMFVPEYEYGLCYADTAKAVEEGVYFSDSEITTILSKHFEVEVTSVHVSDTSGTMSVWIVYQ